MLIKLTEKLVHFSAAKHDCMKVRITFARKHELIHYKPYLHNGKHINQALSHLNYRQDAGMEARGSHPGDQILDVGILLGFYQRY